MSNLVEPLIKRLIDKKGHITFAEFMSTALYEPEVGYYSTKSPVGKSGDYFTSPTAHPAFGALLSLQIKRMWQSIGQPSKFFVIEIGSGSDLLAKDITNHIQLQNNEFKEALNYITIDRNIFKHTNSSLLNIQKILSDRIPLRNIEGCFISNELIDSFPVHKFKIQNGIIKEIFVSLDNNRNFVEILEEPSTQTLVDRITEVMPDLPENFVGEVNLNISLWIKDVSRALKRGFVFTIDYGHLATELYSSIRNSGTIETYYKHSNGFSPYENLGEQDITAHVDFSQLISSGDYYGLNSLMLGTQSEYLKKIGFMKIFNMMRNTNLNLIEKQANLMGMLELIRPEGLGSFKILIQEKDTGISEFAQLLPNEEIDSRNKLPILQSHHMPLLQGKYPYLQSSENETWHYLKGNH